MENSQEQLPVKVVDRILGGNCKVRVALAMHPILKEIAPCVPVADYADVFSYDREAIRRMIERTPWLEKYSVSVIMEDTRGHFRPHQAMFEESALGIFMKLQPQRCKDTFVAEHINERQEELILTLRDVLKGNIEKKKGFCNEEQGLLPRPGLSMNTVPQLCKQANRGCRFSVRALNFFFDMPVNDLTDDVLESDPNMSEMSALIVEYLEAVLEERDLADVRFEPGSFILKSEDIYKTFFEVSRRRGLKKFFSSQYTLAALMRRESYAIEALGWRKILESISNGRRTYRFEKIR